MPNKLSLWEKSNYDDVSPLWNFLQLQAEASVSSLQYACYFQA